MALTRVLQPATAKQIELSPFQRGAGEVPEAARCVSGGAGPDTGILNPCRAPVIESNHCPMHW